jgi:hypothetical protein
MQALWRRASYGPLYCLLWVLLVAVVEGFFRMMGKDEMRNLEIILCEFSFKRRL